MYQKFIKPILFLFDPEKVHHFIFYLLKRSPYLARFFSSSINNNPNLSRNVFGLHFKNPVGLAAGFDKDAKLYKELSHMGFGFIEIGTLTPVAQKGNEKKRLFRLPKDQAIINRMGFNNEGVDAAVERLRKNKNVLIGGNIGKNKNTKNENAADDYLICFEKLFSVVDYFVVNVSSPNTPNLRVLQDKAPLKQILHTLMLNNLKKKSPKPILLKIAPDLNEDQLLDIIEIVQETKIAGVIATNTTITRPILHSNNASETGGLSGKPLTDLSTKVIRFLSQNNNKSFPIIGVGGIHTVTDAIEKLEAGASLIQLYTGFIYNGPELITEINKEILKRGL